VAPQIREGRVVDDLVSPLRAVCVMDDAIDRGRSKVAVYAETRDLAHLAFEDGLPPLVFVLRPLSVVEFASCDSLPSAETALLRAFMISCQGIEGLGLAHGGGLVRSAGLAWHPTTRVDDGMGGTRLVVSDAEVNMLGRELGADWLYEMGSVAYDRARLGKRLGGGAVSYTLPRSSALELSRIAHRLAERLEEMRSTASSAASVTPSPPTSPPTSDAPTDAPAPAGT